MRRMARGVRGGWCPFLPIFPQRLAQRWRPQGWERAGLGSVPASEAPDPGPHTSSGPLADGGKPAAARKRVPRHSEHQRPPQALRLSPAAFLPLRDQLGRGWVPPPRAPLPVTGTRLLPALPLPRHPCQPLECFPGFSSTLRKLLDS